jgi:predicted DNA-binding ribbon-helix-helix protein
MSVIKRSIVIVGHKTSISLEDVFWNALREIAAARRLPISELVASIDADRKGGNLSSAIRVFVFSHHYDVAGRANQPTRETAN